MHRSFGKVAREMRSQGGTAPVTENENCTLLLVRMEQDLGDFIHLPEWQISYGLREKLKVRPAIGC